MTINYPYFFSLYYEYFRDEMVFIDCAKAVFLVMRLKYPTRKSGCFTCFQDKCRKTCLVCSAHLDDLTCAVCAAIAAGAVAVVAERPIPVERHFERLQRKVIDGRLWRRRRRRQLGRVLERSSPRRLARSGGGVQVTVVQLVHIVVLLYLVDFDVIVRVGVVVLVGLARRRCPGVERLWRRVAVRASASASVLGQIECAGRATAPRLVHLVQSHVARWVLEVRERCQRHRIQLGVEGQRVHFVMCHARQLSGGHGGRERRRPLHHVLIDLRYT
ncbi:hypothetical protein BpHYR1_020555 [Brachionus plicatilis]|uniref:Uncharacterized protein n=1 Tax=Brachionus plicatilis TaxID=10195 RepID=A0A3M7S8J3_BRAPC|nr:hypothetical protein BpHYR1_020555 [Brachionus plicatilis]